MEIAIRNHTGASSVQVSDAVFGVEYKPGLVHQVVTAYLAGARAGTKAQKNLRRFLVVVPSRGARREPDVLGREPRVARYGARAV